MLYARLQRFLSAPRAERRVALLAFIVSLPALGIGLQADDYDLFAEVAQNPWSAYAFSSADPEVARTQVIADRLTGMTPWWTYEGRRQRFIRPLTSLSFWLDAQLWAAHPFVMHLENCIAYALVVWLAGLLFTRFALRFAVPEAALAPALATAFYAFNATHSVVVGWISARNTLFGALFGLACILLYLRSREPARTCARIVPALLACACFLLALLGSEGGVGALGFLIAHALVLDRAHPRSRVLALVPYGVITIVWRLWYTHAGGGVTGSGFYRDVGSDPLGFVQGVLTAVPIYLGSQFTFPYANLAALLPGALVPLVLLSLAVLLWLARYLRPLLTHDPVARFFALGSLLAIVPLGATMPQDRLVLFVALGTCSLLARLVVDELARPTGDQRRAVRWLWRVHAIYIPALFAPLLFGCMAKALGGGATALEHILPRAAQPTVFLINSPSPLLPHFAARMREHARLPHPTVIMLYSGAGAVTLTRTAKKGLELRAVQGWLRTPVDRADRDIGRHPLTNGQALELAHVTLTILELNAEGAPIRVRFDFDRELEDGAFSWFAWHAHGPETFAPPAVGAHATIDGVSPL